MFFLIIIRSIIATFIFLPLSTLFFSILIFIFLPFDKKYLYINKFILNWAKFSCWLYGVEIKLTGAEAFIPGGAILLFNHRSFFDIFALSRFFPQIRYGAKIELFSIPIFGYAMRAVGTLPIPRQNREAAIHILREAYSRAQRGQKFALSPEGGRNSGKGLLPFKAGPFVFAIEAGVPLLPVVIIGAEDVWPKGSLLPALKSWHSKIDLKILPPVSVDGFTVKGRDKLQAEVYNLMDKELLSCE